MGRGDIQRLFVPPKPTPVRARPSSARQDGEERGLRVPPTLCCAGDS